MSTQREIKFRAWNGVAKRFQYATIVELASGDNQYYKNLEWKQYTGLKDANGVEIYEGDVVDAFETIDTPYYFWHDKDEPDSKPPYESTRFVVEQGLRTWLKGEQFGYEGELLIDPSYMEVIGNIHDNAELLEGPQ